MEEQEVHGTDLIVIPQTGQAVNLRSDPPEALASFAASVQDLRGELADIEDAVRKELVRRLDRRGSWTLRVRDGEREFEVKAASPTAGTTSYDAVVLEEMLLALLATDEIDAEAADQALERTVSAVFKVPLAAGDLETVKNALGQAKEITIGGVTVEVAKLDATRKVRAAGMTALGKIPAVAAAGVVEACSVTTPAPERRATVTEKRKER